MWVHMTNGLCDWRADTSLLNAYVENSEEALMWYLNRAGLTDQTEYGDGSLVDSVKDPSSLLHNDEKEIFAYMCTSQDLTGVWKDRMDTYDFGDEHCYFFAPWIGPSPRTWATCWPLCWRTCRPRTPIWRPSSTPPPSSWCMRTAR